MKTEDLLVHCQSAAAGRLPLAEFHKLLDRQQLEIDGWADRFFAEVDQAGSSFSQRFLSQLEAVEGALSDYAQAIDQLGQGHIEAGSIGLEEAALALRRATQVYEHAVLCDGPSQFPLVNYVENLSQARSAGRLSDDSWHQALGQHLGVFEGAIVEIDRSLQRKAPGVPERRQALQDCAACLRELEQNPSSELLSRLAAAQHDLASALDAYHRHVFGIEPTGFPSVNWVIHAAEGVLRGKFTVHILKAVAAELIGKLERALEGGRQMAVDSLPTSDLLDALESMLEALQDLYDDCAQPPLSLDLVEERLTRLEDAAALFQQVSQAVGQESEILCPFCQSANNSFSLHCIQCGARLPRIAGDSRQSTFELLEGVHPTTPSLAGILEAYAQWLAGSIEQAQFLAGFDPLEEALQRAQESLSALRAPSLPSEASQAEVETAREFITVAQECLDLLEQGVAECRRGLEFMRQGGLQRRPADFREGQRLYREGHLKMQQVAKVDEILDNYLKPLRTD